MYFVLNWITVTCSMARDHAVHRISTQRKKSLAHRLRIWIWKLAKNICARKKWQLVIYGDVCGVRGATKESRIKAIWSRSWRKHTLLPFYSSFAILVGSGRQYLPSTGHFEFIRPARWHNNRFHTNIESINAFNTLCFVYDGPGCPCNY